MKALNVLVTKPKDTALSICASSIEHDEICAKKEKRNNQKPVSLTAPVSIPSEMSFYPDDIRILLTTGNYNATATEIFLVVMRGRKTIAPMLA